MDSGIRPPRFRSGSPAAEHPPVPSTSGCNFSSGSRHVESVSRTDIHEPLDCAAARSLIDAYQLDELAAGGRRLLAGHLRDCPTCSAELGSVTRLMGLLAALPNRRRRRTWTNGSSSPRSPLGTGATTTGPGWRICASRSSGAPCARPGHSSRRS